LKIINIKIPALVILSILIIGCSDIVNSDPNKVGIKKVGDSPNLEEIVFRFDLDNLTFIHGDTTNQWSVSIPFVWSKTFNIKYIGNDSLKISNVSMLNSRDFNVYALNSLPIVLKPNEIKPQDVIVLELKTANLAPGIYIDKVIINNDVNSGFYIRIKVN
jgi:hypothetical protein